MKKLATISLFIFWMVVTAILTAGLIFYQGQMDSRNSNGASPSAAANTPATGTQISADAKSLIEKTSFTLDMAEIAKHSSANNCWLLINNKVYDVTSFLSAHPGGEGTITPYCGQEATRAFDTKDIGKPHSRNANAMLADYYVGSLNQVFNQAPAKGNGQANTDPLSTTAVNGSPTKNNPAATTSAVTAPAGNVTLDLTEISKHNSARDCWLLINSKVYNVTSFLSAHPGGAGTITPYCGKEATQAFNTKDIGRPHSSNASAMLGSYYIGSLNQSIGQQQIQQNVQNTNTITPPVRGRDEEDD